MKILKGVLIMALSLLSILGITACSKNKTNSLESIKPSYQQISQKEAKEIMDTESDYIILDTRTQEEFNQGHIPNAICISHEEIAEKAPELLPQKDKLLLVYCRSGRRSKIAAEELVKLGYTNIKEFGGIIDWPYETTK